MFSNKEAEMQANRDWALKAVSWGLKHVDDYGNYLA
jgi:hypothetical protein